MSQAQHIAILSEGKVFLTRIFQLRMDRCDKRWSPVTHCQSRLVNWPFFPSSFQDQTVRRAAVDYFKQIPDGELEVFLPQLVQVS